MGSAALGTALASPKSSSDTVRIACVGLRGRGKSHLEAFTTLPNVDLVAICDIDQSVLADACKFVEGTGKKAPAPYTDLRKLLEDKSIDAISIATTRDSAEKIRTRDSELLMM